MDKPYKTFEEQIFHLIKTHNLVVPNIDVGITILKSMSYYDLVNGYKDHFMINDKYDGSITINDLYLYSLFDRAFQNILFKYSVFVENRFRNILAHVIAEKISEDQNEYLDPIHYHEPQKPERAEKFYKLFKELKSVYMAEDISRIPEPTKHYVETKNHIPPWILFKNIGFSNLTDLYSFLTPEMQLCVAAEMVSLNISDEEKIKLCGTGLVIIRKYRNLIAHDLKFTQTLGMRYGVNVRQIKQSSGRDLITHGEIKKGIGKSDHYSMIISTVTLLNNNVLIRLFNQDLIILFRTYEQGRDKWAKETYLDNLNIPADLTDRITNYISNNQ